MTLDLKNYQRNTLKELEGFFSACRSLAPADAYKTALTAQNRTNEPDYVDVFDGAPSVCMRIPTGGGKTLLAAHAINTAAKVLRDTDAPVALWLTPSDVIRTQTLEALNTPGHPYRAALEQYYPQRLRVCDLENLQTVGRHELGTAAVVIVATIQSFRVSDTNKRNVYSFYEELAPHFEGLSPASEQRLEKVSNDDLTAQPFLTTADLGRVKYSVVNWLALHRPIVIVDEAHNSRTETSYKTLNRLQPACVIEMTATPCKGSNVLYHVSAQELKAEQMIKLPIVLTEHPTDWRDAVRDAILRRNTLEIAAQMEPDYLHPIVLFQAQPHGEAATVEVLRAHLIEQEKIPAEQIAVATGTQKELDGINLFDPLCPIRYVITVEALKEGWDCSFAYVLCSLQEMRSAKDVEQLLGRVLRMPYARNRTQPQLNQAYAHVVAASFSEAVERLTDRMVQNMGFEAFEAASIFQPQVTLPLTGGANGLQRPLIPDCVVTVSQAPIIDHLPQATREKIEIRPTSQGTTVIIRGEVDEETESALIAPLPKNEKETVRERIEMHRAQARALNAPSTQRLPFAPIPQLCLRLEGEWQVVERETLTELGEWSLLNAQVQLAGFAIHESANVFEIDIQNKKVISTPTSAERQLSLDTAPTALTETDLVRWLNIEVRQSDITQVEMLKYLGLLVQYLQRDRGMTLTALWRAKFQLAEAVRLEIERLRQDSQNKGFQKALFEMQAMPAEMQHFFEFKPDCYPARAPYYSGRYQFAKHYYPVIHDLKSKGEEYECAKVIDAHPEVKHWVRNIPKQEYSSFWLPTASDYFYPDFVSELKDGRLLVIEYKGEQYVTNDDSREKIQIGEHWEKTSGGHCLFLMAVNKDAKGRSVGQQVSDTIAGKF